MKYRSRKNRLRRRILILLLAALIVTAAICAHASATTVLATAAEAELRARTAVAVNEAVFAALSDGVRYSDIITIERDGEGNIEAITANTLTINRIARETAQTAQTELRLQCAEPVHIPLGAFTGVAAWAGFGPEIAMEVNPVAAVTCAFRSDFEAAGINQTRHSVYLEIEAEVEIVVPGKGHSFSATSQVLIAESVLVGDVPNVYLEGGLLA